MKPLALSALVLAVAGCGGLTPGLKPSYEVSPERATVAPGGAVTLTAHVTEAPYTSVEFSVAEGSAGGTVVAAERVPGTEPNATYTAPAKSGTYHVRARVMDGTEVAATRTATITVRKGG